MSKQSDLINLTDAITVDGSNNVGIGMTPTAGLSIRPSGTGSEDTHFGYGANLDAYITTGSNGNVIFREGDGAGVTTERMRIDSAGRVTMPYQPVFSATGAGTNTSYSAGDVMFFNTNAGFSSPHYNTSTYTFTAPVTGKYQFNLHLYCYTNHKFHSVFTINGSYPTYSGDVLTITMNDLGDEGEVAGSAILYLNANDYVRAQVRPGASGANIYMRHSHFSGFLIG